MMQKKKGWKRAADENCNYDIAWTGKVEYKPVMKLDKDFDVAMKKLETLNVITADFPDWIAVRAVHRAAEPLRKT